MGDGVKSKGRRSCTGRLQTTTGGDDRHHVQAQPHPASEETTHDDIVRPAATHNPGELAIPPRPRGKAVSGQDRCHTLCIASHGLRGQGRWTQLNRQKDDVAAGEQDSEKKQSDLVSLNPGEKPRCDAESRVTVALHTLRRRPVQQDGIC